MIRQLHDVRIAVGIHSRDPQGAALEPIAEGLVEAEIAGKLFLDDAPAVYLEGAGAGENLNGPRDARQRALEPADQGRGRVRRAFLMVCIGDSQNMARILYQSMLESASGGEKGPVGFPGKPDGIERPRHAAVRAAG